MEFIEVIKNYLKDAPIYELNQVDIILAERLRQVPQLQINEAVVRAAVPEKCREMYDGTNKLMVVKFFKEMTGMGLKHSKDWCDANIFNQIQ